MIEARLGRTMRTRIRATDASGDPSDPFSLPSALNRARELPLTWPVFASALFLAALEACDPGGVAEPEPSLEIVPDSVTLTHIGERFAFTVRGGTGSDQVRWSSRDTTVFVVDGNGFATARGNGSAYVRAADLKSADHAVVQVHQVADALEPFGEGQQAARGLSPPDPVGVRVLDAGGAPVSGVAVRFEAGVGGGRVEPGLVHSDNAGLAVTEWTLGPVPGRQTLAVSAEGVAEIEIVATALEPDEAVASFDVRAGEDQWAWSGRALAEPVVVLAMDEDGRPVPGATVRFEPGGTGIVDPETAVSDSAGLAATGWTLETASGPQTLTVSAGVASVEITAMARDPDDAVASVEVHSGEDQWTLAALALPDPVTVRLADERGQPIWGATVRFEPDAVSGRADPDRVTTDSLGLASAVWTLGLELGTQRLRATAGDASVAFEATAVLDAGVCNRTPAVSAEIATRARVGSCAEVTQKHLERVTWLDLPDAGIWRLRSGDFAGLLNLGSLHLQDNELTELPTGVFDELARLVHLNLSGNQLKELPAGLLANTPELRNLYLDENELAELPAGILRGLSGLKRLDLHTNKLSVLAPDVFDDLSDLDDIDLSRNRLMALAPGTFADLPALRHLSLHYNELTELPPDVFDGLSNLTSLGLVGNKLTSLPEGIFSGLSRLDRLLLAINRLTELPPRLFSETPALRVVGLDKNRLRHLPPDLFADTPELWTILLHENDLTELPQGIFDGSPSLRRLDLSRNQLTELPSGIFDGTPKLARLGLDWNELTELPRGVFAGLSELDWVTLGDNPGAPFPVLPEFARIDVGDPLAPGPARVVARVLLGAPFRLEIPVSVQRGTISHDVVVVPTGDTVSAPFVVSGVSEDTSAVHVGFGPPPEMTAAGYGGLELVRGEDLVLFAREDNRSPVARSRIPGHRLQVGASAADVVLGGYFDDPDGDSLTYSVTSTEPGAVGTRVDGGVLRLDPRSVDASEIEVTATDPEGLRATQKFRAWVVPAPDPDAFNIELYFEPGFTEEAKAEIRRAADRWMEAVVGDLPDVPVDGPLVPDCYGCITKPRFTGVIDDLLIRMRVASRLGGALATASAAGDRESGLAFLANNAFIKPFLDLYLDALYETALHEIGHALGIGGWDIRDRNTDPHFAGPLAVAAFDAAGGEAYAGGKVPVEDRNALGRFVHWRSRIIPGDVMSVGRGQLVTAITLQALADLGHEVDLTKADPYKLPGQAQGDVQGVAVGAEESVTELWADDVIEGPVVVVDRNGKVVRVIRR
ncbi:MAG: leucine-rich repeat protein [Gemmatimonadales bacterium]|nr:leucine-rich repeat protein [Candidatus Palauibacter irciniicola]